MTRDRMLIVDSTESDTARILADAIRRDRDLPMMVVGSESQPLTEKKIDLGVALLAPKRPPAHWTRAASPPFPVEAWTYGGLMVLSSLDGMEAPDGSGDVLPTWLISVSKAGKRASDRDCQRALQAFDASAALEDNHHPGISRAFFLVVDEARRVDCECKVGERLVTEPDGFQWSNDISGLCRGCEYERAFGKPCPVPGHAGEGTMRAP